MNVGHVAGGTHAGWRIVKQPRQWTHTCPAGSNSVNVQVTMTAYSCPCCGKRRPR